MAMAGSIRRNSRRFVRHRVRDRARPRDGDGVGHVRRVRAAQLRRQQAGGLPGPRLHRRRIGRARTPRIDYGEIPPHRVRGRRRRAKRLLSENRKGLESVSEALLEYETLDGEDIERLLKGESGAPASHRAQAPRHEGRGRGQEAPGDPAGSRARARTRVAVGARMRALLRRSPAALSRLMPRAPRALASLVLTYPRTLRLGALPTPCRRPSSLRAARLRSVELERDGS